MSFTRKLNPKNWFSKANEETLTPQSTTKLFFLELFKLAVFAFITIFLVRYFLFKPFYVRGASMEPNFFDHEYLIVNEISYRFEKPNRGDIVVFHYPLDRKQYFLKRVIGLPGERVKLKDGSVYIYNDAHPDGEELTETYLPAGLMTKPEISVTLKDGQYFLMGDNRNSSYDSRYFGPVDQKDIVGKVFIRGWPFNRAQVFGTTAY